MTAPLQNVLSRLRACRGVTCRTNVLLSELSSWRIGGSADVVAEPATTQAVADVIGVLREASCPWIVIGAGSNLLFDSDGFRGVIIRIGSAMAWIESSGASMRFGAGVQACRLAHRAAQIGRVGLEHIVGIPGTMGGLVAMNGGSLRQNIGDVVREVVAVDVDGRVRRWPAEECGFDYRTSRFQTSGEIVVEATIELKAGEPKAIRRSMLDILKSRRSKFPMDWPNCGSVFLNDAEIFVKFGPPGKVVEDTGCKGWRVGDAQVSERHANFIVNLGSATSKDVITLVDRIRHAAHERTGLWLTCEVRYVSPTGALSSVDACAERIGGANRTSI